MESGYIFHLNNALICPLMWTRFLFFLLLFFPPTGRPENIAKVIKYNFKAGRKTDEGSEGEQEEGVRRSGGQT